MAKLLYMSYFVSCDVITLECEKLPFPPKYNPSTASRHGNGYPIFEGSGKRIHLIDKEPKLHEIFDTENKVSKEEKRREERRREEKGREGKRREEKISTNFCFILFRFVSFCFVLFRFVLFCSPFQTWTSSAFPPGLENPYAIIPRAVVSKGNFYIFCSKLAVKYLPETCKWESVCSHSPLTPIPSPLPPSHTHSSLPSLFFSPQLPIPPIRDYGFAQIANDPAMNNIWMFDGFNTYSFNTSSHLWTAHPEIPMMDSKKTIAKLSTLFFSSMFEVFLPLSLSLSSSPVISCFSNMLLEMLLMVVCSLPMCQNWKIR